MFEPNHQPVRRSIMAGLFLVCLWCVGDSVGGEGAVSEPPWSQSAKDLRFELTSDKPAYKAGEPVNLTFTITNVAGEAKVMLSGNPLFQFAIWVYRDGEQISSNESKSVAEIERAFSSLRPTEPIPAGKSHVERLELSRAYDLTIPGIYTVRAEKPYGLNNTLRTRKDEKKGVDYLEATLKFTILPLK